jgi:molecular chaperone DnaK (HSP70)
MSTPRFLVGIDLGTTHTAVAYADISDGIESAQTSLFEIEQLVAPGEVAKKPLLPSFRYHPTQGELATEDLFLPWTEHSLPGGIEQVVVGEWARELGAKVDGRLVSSAKSWLSHPQVDRSAAILPWGAVEGVAKVSPVVASASYLNHVRQAWNHEHPDHPLEDQEVVVTIPASFDEIARSLTVEAANMAGLPNILLLEEPQAVCYDWYAKNRHQAKSQLDNIRLLLVCDVGGGTTDLSLIKVAVDNKGELSLTRIGVGDHLMLGGDNVDLALAHTAEQRIVKDGKKLNAGSLSQLIQQTRKAKELLLSKNPPESASVTVLGSGSRLIGGAKSCELSRDEVRSMALDGFFPLIDFSERPKKHRSAVLEFGLPYAADPAVSKHVAAFIAAHKSVCSDALQQQNLPDQAAIPDAVLFNGGVFNSVTLRERALEVLSNWGDKKITQLDNPSPDLAVAFGAVAYSMARHGAHLKIGGGSARSYFLRLDHSHANNENEQGVCLLAKGTETGEEIHLSTRKFALRLGQPVSFHLLSSTADLACKSGDLINVNEESFISLPPLIAALDKADDDKNEVEVSLVATSTEVGTLLLQCEAVNMPEQRWNLEFQIRKDLARQRLESSSQETEQLPANFDAACNKINDAFGQKKKDADPKAIKKLRTDLEKLLGKREQWDTTLLRALFDRLLDGSKKRRRSLAHERIWFNLSGYAIRPGFGHPLDNWRIEQIWPLYQQGLQFNKENPSWSEWWTFWRRIAGGLNEQQQQSIYEDISIYINPNAMQSRKLQNEIKYKSYEDMVRLVASLEHLPVATKIELGKHFLTRLEKSSETQTSWWALGRIASRVPFHGSAHNVIPQDTIHEWLPKLLQADWKKNQHIAFAAVLMSRMSGDRSRDIDDTLRQTIIKQLTSSKAPSIWVEMVADVKELDSEENKRVFGEALPAGLKLII